MPHHSRSRNKSYSKDRKDHYNQHANYSEEIHDKNQLKKQPEHKRQYADHASFDQWK
jgi:hypothetical protein